MIHHALHILSSELASFLQHEFPPPDPNDDPTSVGITNIGAPDNSPPAINLTMIRLEEETSMRNKMRLQQNQVTNKTEYQNPAIHLNLFVLFSIHQTDYSLALILLSRVIRFFQQRNAFDHQNTTHIVYSAFPKDKMTEYKLVAELYSPKMEEISHIWGILESKVKPFVMYKVRLVELSHDATYKQGGIIEKIKTNTTEN